MKVFEDTRVEEKRVPICLVIPHQEGQRSWLGPVLCWVYGFVRPRLIMRSFIRWLVEKMEGGQLYSLTLRDIMRKYHGVEVGLYSSGAPFTPGGFVRGTTIGRYCSIYGTVRSFNANHPRNIKSTHALFYNPALGFASEDLITRPPKLIGNDVFIGHNAIIMPQARKVGDGAFIGAGAVVYEDVPPYAIVIGNPARVVSYRFKKQIIEELLAERWWEKSLEEIAHDLDSFRRSLDGGPIR